MNFKINKQIILKILITAILLSTIMYSYNRELVKDYNGNYLLMLFFSYGGIINPDIKVLNAFFFSFILYFVPCILIMIFYFNNYVYQDFKNRAIYYFTRNNKRIKWLLIRYSEMLLYLLFYYFICISTLNILYILLDFKTDENVFLMITGSLYALTLLAFYGFFVLLIGNLITILLGEKFGLLINILISSILVTLAVVVKNKFIMFLNPAYHGHFVWHNNSFLKFQGEYICENSFWSIELSLIYIIVLSAIILITNCMIMKNMELIKYETTY